MIRILFLCVAYIISSLPSHAQDTLRIGTIALPPSLGDPYQYSGIPHLWTLSAVFDGLTRIDKNGALRPWLATDWEAEDQYTWLISLRKSVEFSNGEEFNATAVVNAINYLIDDNTVTGAVAPEFKFILTAEIVDNHTVRIITKIPAPGLPRVLPLLHIVEPKHWYNLGPKDFAKNPVGTGPYHPTEFSPTQIKFEAVNTSWRAPKISKLEIIATPDSYSRSQAVITGEIDIAMGLGPDEIHSITNNGGKGLDWRVAAIWAIHFHHNNGSPLDNVSIRQALNIAINRDTLIENLLDGRTVPANQPGPAVAFGFDPTIPEIEYNPQKARQLLEEAGYQNGFKFVVEGAIGAGANDSAVYQQVAQDLANVGVIMEIRTVSVPQLIRSVIEGQWNGDAFGITYATEPTIDVLRPMRNHSCLWYHPWYCDESIMPTIKQAGTTFNPQLALTLRHKIMQHYRNQWVSLYLYQTVRFAGTTKNVVGFEEVHGLINYENIYFNNQ
ncbi:MAG: hypothetical protein CMM25_06865 [Rhodospirillaceae bacterium]|nr:hypothetical protein [Rhodospirillaceae bacterium]